MILLTKNSKDFINYKIFFSRPMIFYYFDFKLQLFINFDVLKKFKVDEHVYHVFIDLKHFQDKFLNKKNFYLKKNKMKSIMFFSRELTDVETRYWPTEMKTATLVWIIKKIRHFIETIKHFIIIYIDHSVTVAIVQQSNLNTIFVIKLNLRLIRSSEYLQWFKLNIRHIQNKTNIISNALSRFASSNDKKKSKKTF